MYSDTERLEMLSVSIICWFLIPYERSDMSLGDTETIVSYDKSREIFVTYLWINLLFN